MFPRRRVVAAALAVAFVALALLFFHAKSITPRSLRIGEIGGDDAGLPIRIRGHVHRAWTTEDGNAGLSLIDYADFATVRVIARPRAIAQPTLVAPGALVEVTGELFGSGAFVQVFAAETGDVRVLEPSSSNLLPLEFVARNAARLEGERVLVRARLSDVYAVVDPLHAQIHGDGETVWAYSREAWTEGRADLTGRLAVSSRGRCELFVGIESHPVDTTVPALAACPDVLLGQPVRLRNVVVEPGEILGTALRLTDLGDGAEFHLSAFVRGWDWRRDAPLLRLDALVTMQGDVEYQATEARWRIVGEEPPRI